MDCLSTIVSAEKQADGGLEAQPTVEYCGSNAEEGGVEAPPTVEYCGSNAEEGEIANDHGGVEAEIEVEAESIKFTPNRINR